jgi:hypothetical protein
MSALAQTGHISDILKWTRMILKRHATLWIAAAQNLGAPV